MNKNRKYKLQQALSEAPASLLRKAYAIESKGGWIDWENLHPFIDHQKGMKLTVMVNVAPIDIEAMNNAQVDKMEAELKAKPIHSRKIFTGSVREFQLFISDQQQKGNTLFWETKQVYHNPRYGRPEVFLLWSENA